MKHTYVPMRLTPDFCGYVLGNDETYYCGLPQDSDDHDLRGL